MHHEELIDVRFQVDRGLAWITIDRPECLNAFRARTVDELIRAFKAAWVDSSVGVVALTGAGDRAFCVGGGHVLHVICDLTLAAAHATFHDKRPPDFAPFRGAAAGQKPADQPVAP
ncbi:MAG: 1,4-dihydroxy-2-naphthoyl-CoA synthase [Blastococcus sp.]|nr:1,4-dihydroxy-2-naphthoyl-CoA synthase [Blastococcus sp.]